MTVLTVMAGLPGAGKTVWASRHRGDAVLLSTDPIRVNRLDPGTFFAVLGGQVAQHLAAGRDVIVDACSLLQAHRLAWLRIARAAGATTRLVIVDTPAAVCRARDLARGATASQGDRARYRRDWQRTHRDVARERWGEVLTVAGT